MPPLDDAELRRSDGTLVYCLSIDETAGIIRTTACGFWRIEEATNYLEILKRFVSDLRQRSLRVRVLGNLVDAPVQSEAVATLFEAAHTTIYRHEDRLALVLKSQIARGQWQRRLQAQVFTDSAEAEAWLLAS